MAYWFFFSYAHADDNDFVRKFYEDLDKEVRQLTGAARAEISFFDRDKIAHGDNWDVALEDALKSCRVFVPLYSASYFRSEYCGKEFAVFRERLHDYLRQQGVVIADTLILPVLWSHEQNVLEELPPVINTIQYDHGSYPSVYAAEGVSMMVKLGTSSGKYFNEYSEFVSRLANTIVDRAKKVALPPLTSSLTALGNVTSLFSPGVPLGPGTPDGGPRYVQFIFVAAKRSEIEDAKARKGFECYGQNGGSDWQPYLDTYQGNAASLAIETIEAFAKDSYYEEVTIGTDIEEQVRQAEIQKKIVVVMVDTWTLQLRKYKEIIAPLDQYSSLNCITIIAWNEGDKEATTKRSSLEAAVGGAFKTKVIRNPADFRSTPIKSYDSFKEELIKALNQARSDLIRASELEEKGKYVEIETPHANFGSVSL